MMAETPSIRVRDANGGPIQPRGDYVLYWMIATRRTRRNFALQRALEIGAEIGRPVLVLEPLRVAYPWASQRTHRFVLDGMVDNALRFADAGITHHPYVEPEPGAGEGLLVALAQSAACVVTDEYPTSFLPRMVAAAAGKLPVRLEVVDSNGILPLRASERAYPTAATFRRFFQKAAREHLTQAPAADPLAGSRRIPVRVPAEIAVRWPAADPDLLVGSDPSRLDRLPIDREVPAVEIRGGSVAGEATLELFVEERLARYAEDRNQPALDATSRLSPYLHFGHVSIHDVVGRVLARDGWNPARISPESRGARAGWWGAHTDTESFLDESVIWRELGYHFAWHRPDDHATWESLPPWARETLEDHAPDPRPHVYDRAAFEAAETHDPLWNAAQRQLREEGRIHNYLRMLWGKKVLEWSPHPREALETLLALNDRWAIDGRDPNSVSGVFWVFGRFDRPWGPEREIFGRIRYMTSKNTARKYDVRPYLERWGEPAALFPAADRTAPPVRPSGGAGAG